MKHTRLIALVAAIALVASPMTWARSGFGSSRASVSTARVSTATVSRGSGFGSMRASGDSAPAPAVASPRPATSGFGTSLYAANASKQAASTYAANKAATSSPNYGRTPQTVAANTSNVGGNTYNSYHYNTAPAYSPAPLVQHHYHDHYYDSGSGTHNFLLGWMMGRATEPHTVVVQQPAPVQYVEAQPQYAPSPAYAPAPGQYEPQPAGVVTQAGVQSSPTQAQAASSAWTNAAQPGAQDVAVPAQQKSGHPVLHFFAWVFGLGLAGFGVYKLLSAWSARKARYTPTNHYKL